jgi:hypothetical protein
MEPLNEKCDPLGRGVELLLIRERPMNHWTAV